jgi:hypothetical protein
MDLEHDNGFTPEFGFIAYHLLEIINQINFHNDNSDIPTTYINPYIDIKKFNISHFFQKGINLKTNINFENTKNTQKLDKYVNGNTSSNKSGIIISIDNILNHYGLSSLFNLMDQLIKSQERFIDLRFNQVLHEKLSNLKSFLNKYILQTEDDKQINWKDIKNSLWKNGKWDLQILNVPFNMQKLNEIFNEKYKQDDLDWKYFVGLSLLYRDESNDYWISNKFGKDFLVRMINKLWLNQYNEFKNMIKTFLPGMEKDFPEIFSDETVDRLWVDIKNTFYENNKDAKPYAYRSRLHSGNFSWENFGSIIWRSSNNWNRSIIFNEILLATCFDKVNEKLKQEKIEIMEFLDNVDNIQNCYDELSNLMLILENNLSNDSEEYDIIRDDEQKNDDEHKNDDRELEI